MGIDIHVGNHYYSVHVPTPALLVVLLVVLYAVWKLGGFALAAIGR
jgi:hypothetical protein